MPKSDRTPPLLPHHRADLEQSGLDAAAIAANGFYSEHRPKKAAELLGWQGSAPKIVPCLVIPFFNPDGTPTGYSRVRPDTPREKGGKTFKYEAPYGQPNRVYFPVDTRRVVSDPAVSVLVTEGEKKACCADAHGLPCIGLTGVDAWSVRRPKGPDGKPTGHRLMLPDLARVDFRGRRVTVVFDSDAATKKDVLWAEWRLAEALTTAGATVRVVRLPAAADGSKLGLDDFVAANGIAAVKALVDEAGRPKKPKRDNPPAAGPGPDTQKPPAAGPADGRGDAPASAQPASGAAEPDEKPKPPAAADVLVAIGTSFALWHDADKRAFASRGRMSYRVKSTAFRQLLRVGFRDQTGKVPNAEAEQVAVNMIEAAAVWDGPERTAHVRVAAHEDKRYLDLADAEGRVVEIDTDGWRLCDTPPVRFVRPEGMLPLPEPVPGGDVAELRRFVNLPDDGDFALYLACLDMGLCPAGPYPVLLNIGEHGSGKSTTGEAYKVLLDPARLKRRSPPRSEDDLYIAAVKQQVLLFDNMRSLPNWLSDTLCRLSTGGGFGKRTLYENDEETVFDAMRPSTLNGINDFAEAPDLLDRAVILRHGRMPSGKKLTEKQLWAAFEAVRPRLLGALLERASGAMRSLARVDLGEETPRMADFAVYAVAAEIGAGGTGRVFLDAYRTNRHGARQQSLDSSPVPAAVLRLMSDRETRWAGTPTELLAILNSMTDDRDARDWPKKPNLLTNTLRTHKPDMLEVMGLDMELDGHDGTKAANRQVTITWVRRPEKAGNPSSASSASSADGQADAQPGYPADDADDADGDLQSVSGAGSPAGGWRYRNKEGRK